MLETTPPVLYYELIFVSIMDRMTNTETSSPARERVLQAAERLFAERGLRSVTLRDIADTLHVRAASLYNHAPGGKEQLYFEVTERMLLRHQAGLRAAIESADTGLRQQFRAAARWLLAQSPLNIGRMFQSDVPSLEPAHAARLMALSVEAMVGPLQAAVEAAYQRGEARPGNAYMSALTFLSSVQMIQGIRNVEQTPAEVLADDAIDILLDGILRR